MCTLVSGIFYPTDIFLRITPIVSHIWNSNFYCIVWRYYNLFIHSIGLFLTLRILWIKTFYKSSVELLGHYKFDFLRNCHAFFKVLISHSLQQHIQSSSCPRGCQHVLLWAFIIFNDPSMAFLAISLLLWFYFPWCLMLLIMFLCAF